MGVVGKARGAAGDDEVRAGCGPVGFVAGAAGVASLSYVECVAFSERWRVEPAVALDGCGGVVVGVGVVPVAQETQVVGAHGALGRRRAKGPFEDVLVCRTVHATNGPIAAVATGTVGKAGA